MTVCKHTPGRQMSVSCFPEGDLSQIDESRLSLILIREGLLRFQLNGVDCHVTALAILCLSDISCFRMLHRHNLISIVLSFAPEYINVNLNWEVLRSAEWSTLREQNNYPDMDLFMNTNHLYSGVLPLYDDFFNKVERIFKYIKAQIDEQEDVLWSCRTRSWILTMINALRVVYDTVYPTDETDDLMSQVCGYIAAHLDEPITIKLLSRHFAVNHTTLTQRFKMYTGMTINEYITENRLKNAKYHLAFSSLSTQEIAIMNGFNKASYLTRVFKEKVGVTPLGYRKVMRTSRPNKTKILTNFP